MKLLRRCLWGSAAFALAAVLLSPTGALAKGSNLRFSGETYAPGDQAVGRARVQTWDGSGRPEDAPFDVYLVRGGQPLWLGHLPADAIHVGQLDIGRPLGDGSYEVSVAFEVPRVRADEYAVWVCRAGCGANKMFGDLTYGRIVIRDEPASAPLPGSGGSARRGRPRCTITGTPGPDEDLRETTGPDVICGFGGDDDIYARQGADIVFGGRGDDVLVGRSGRDRLYGGRGWDFIMGREGKDVHAGQKGQDCLAATDFQPGDVVNGGDNPRDHYTSDRGDRLIEVEVNNLRCRNPYDSVTVASSAEEPTGGWSTSSPPDCRWPKGNFEDSLALSSTSGQAGSVVSISGPVPLFDKAGRYDPSTDVEVWWNVDPTTWEYAIPWSTIEPSPAVPGSYERLAATTIDACYFDVDLTIPQVEPGTYPIVLIGVDHEGEGASLYGSLQLEVEQ